MVCTVPARCSGHKRSPKIRACLILESQVGSESRKGLLIGEPISCQLYVGERLKR
jgi:hypothetical protein